MKRAASAEPWPAGRVLVGEERGVAPRRLAVAAPVGAERPARELLARIPLALAEVHEAIGAVVLPEPVEQRGREPALGRAERARVPLGAVAVLGGDERRLAPHGEPHVHALEIAVDGVAEAEDRLPLGLGVRLGHARGFVDARDGHRVLEDDLARVHRAGDGRRGTRLGRAGERDMALAREEAGGRIEADPSRPGQVDLDPGVQIGEVLLRARPARRAP